jgi:hypothetical protein
MTTAWLVILWAKGVLYTFAVTLFCYVSWKLWPRRIFASPAELPWIQWKFRVIGIALLFAAALSFALGILPHTW